LTGNGSMVENKTVIIDCFWSGSVRSAILSAEIKPDTWNR
jgi:hypothetical protein